MAALQHGATEADVEALYSAVGVAMGCRVNFLQAAVFIRGDPYQLERPAGK
jgi:hypothetical protein